MPPVLDRCVTALRGRGVGESSAYAICTASLQRAGRLPQREREALSSEFSTWSEKVDLPETLQRGFSQAFPTISAADRTLLRELRKVTITDREGVLGLARLHSKIIAVNHSGLGRVMHKPIWYGAVALHEAVHACRGFGEHEATRLEQRYAGNQFGASQLALDRETMNDAFRVGVMAQAQRLIDVRGRERRNDFDFLSQTGYTPRMARRIISLGERVGEEMRQKVAIRRAAKSFRTKQYDDVLDGEVNTLIEKAISQEFEKILLGAVGSDEVLKEAHGERYAPDFDATLDGSPAAVQEFERCAKLCAERGLGREYLLGIVPAIRRAGYDARKLPAHECTGRSGSIREAISQAATEGLEKADGSPTDAYVIMVLHGFVPNRNVMSEDANGETSKERQDR